MTTRRTDPLKRIAVRVLAMAAVLTRSASAAADQKKPNLLVIHTDEHHFGTLGCYGGRIGGARQEVQRSIGRRPEDRRSLAL